MALRHPRPIPKTCPQGAVRVGYKMAGRRVSSCADRRSLLWGRVGDAGDWAAGSGGEAAWQTEAGQHARLEAGESRDSLACERHDDKSDGAEDAVAVVADVDAEGGLAVRSRVDEASLALPSMDDASEVFGNGVEAAILERERRHVEAHVGGERGDKAANVAPLESCREALEGLLF